MMRIDDGKQAVTCSFEQQSKHSVVCYQYTIRERFDRLGIGDERSVAAGLAGEKVLPKSVPKISFQKLQKNYRQFGPAFARELAATHGDLFMARPPLLPPIYVVLRPAHVYAVLGQQNPPLEKPALIQRVLNSSVGNGLFTSRGQEWRQQRKLMQPVFHHGKVSRYADLIVKHTEDIVQHWQDGAIISIGEAMHNLTLVIILDALFSLSSNKADTDKIHAAVHDLGEGLAKLAISLPLFLLPDWLPLRPLRQKRRGERALAQSVRQLIEKRTAQGEANSPPDLLSLLLFARDVETGERMTHQQLQDELITLYIAGHETTAVLLAWAWVLLAQHPAVLAQLEDELSRVLGHQTATFDDLSQLPFTAAIVKETLRLYPPVSFLFRAAEPDFALDEISIPPSSLLFLIPYATHRDEEQFVTPDAFQPERWLTGLERSLPRGAYFPFGLGPRICIGNGFALMEAQLILATIAQRFRLEQISDAHMGFGPSLRFTKPVQMRLHAREITD